MSITHTSIYKFDTSNLCNHKSSTVNKSFCYHCYFYSNL